MSEFKFACPVCQQHITADSRASGTQIECPTCFQKIVVPQAPADEGQKFILSATKAGPRRTSREDALVEAAAGRVKPRRRAPWIIAGIFLLMAVAAGAFLWMRQRAALAAEQRAQAEALRQLAAARTNRPTSTHPVPTRVKWSLDLTNRPIPDATAAGRLRGEGFGLEIATFQNGTLALRQGKGWPPDLGVTIVFPAKRIEDFSGKTVEVWPDRPPPVPRVVLRWKDENQEGRSREFLSGYALKAAFGEASEGKLPGRLFLSLPDEEKSFVAGTFSAQIRTNTPGRKSGSKKAPPPVPADAPPPVDPPGS